MAASVSVVSKRHSKIGEGPIWDHRINRLIYVDIFSGIISRLDPETQDEEIAQLSGNFVSLVLPFQSDPNKYLISCNNQLCIFDWNTKQKTVCHEVETGQSTRFNDGKCDSRGRLWAGTMALEISPGAFAENDGNLYSLCKPNCLTKHDSGMRISNGLAWNKANNKMFFIDSIPRRIYVYDYNIETGKPSNRRTLIDFNDDSNFIECGLPDGMTIDADDKLWVAFFNGSRIICIDPDSRTSLRTIYFPCQKITSCTWGGPNYDTLYVTSGYLDLSEDEKKNQPNAGCVFKVTDIGVKGLAPTFYSN